MLFDVAKHAARNELGEFGARRRVTRARDTAPARASKETAGKLTSASLAARDRCGRPRTAARGDDFVEGVPLARLRKHVAADEQAELRARDVPREPLQR
jgi:hypothetical protein